METKASTGEPPADRLLPFVRAAEERLGISRATAYRLLAAGEANTIKIGRLHLIRESEISRMIARFESRTAASRGVAA